jgi:hypothetical protein
MIESLLLILLAGIECAALGWSLHRNFKPHTNPTEWKVYSPFKASDGFWLTMLKGMWLGCLLSGAVAGCSWLFGWCFSVDGWRIAFWMLIDLHIVMLISEGRMIFFRLRWWHYYLSPGARIALSKMWQRDGYSAF